MKSIKTVCLSCGNKRGTKKKDIFGVWKGTCDICELSKISVADAAHDFGIYSIKQDRI